MFIAESQRKKRFNRIVSLLILLAMCFGIVLTTPDTSYAGGTQSSDEVSNVFIYTTDKDNENVLLKVASMKELVEQSHGQKEGNKNYYGSFFDSFVTPTYCEGIGLTIPELLDYVKSKTSVANASSITYQGEDTLKFIATDGKNDSYTYNDLLGVERYYFPELYKNWDLDKQQINDGMKNKVLESAIPTPVYFATKSYGGRVLTGPKDPECIEDYITSNGNIVEGCLKGVLDTKNSLRFVMPQTKDDISNRNKTYDKIAKWINKLIFTTASTSSIEAIGKVDKPTCKFVLDGTTLTITLSCATEGATIYHSLDGTTPTKTAQYQYDYTKPIVIENYDTSKPFNLYFTAVKEGYSDFGEVYQSSKTYEVPSVGDPSFVYTLSSSDTNIKTGSQFTLNASLTADKEYTLRGAEYQVKIPKDYFTVGTISAADGWEGKASDGSDTTVTFIRLNTSGTTISANSPVSLGTISLTPIKSGDTGITIGQKIVTKENSNPYANVNGAGLSLKVETSSTAVTGVSLDKATDTITVGRTSKLKATVSPESAANTKVTWSSSDSTIASVDDTGLVTAKTAGKATITATTEEGSKTASCEVTVRELNTAVWDGSTIDVSWYNTTDKTFSISNPYQLMGLAAIVNGGMDSTVTTILGNGGTLPAQDNFLGKTIELTADLDMGGVYNNAADKWSGPNFMPIGGQWHYVTSVTTDSKGDSVYTYATSLVGSANGASFSGIFDGKGHIVKNINCVRGSGQDNQSVGLIGRLGANDKDPESLWPSNAAVRNVSVSGYIQSGRSVGGIVGKTGKSSGLKVIENCMNYATVKSSDSKGLGGIAGAAWNGGVIKNCANFGKLDSAYKVGGGISGSCEAKVTNCYNVGYVNGGNSIGYNNLNGSAANCYYLKGSASIPGGLDGTEIATLDFMKTPEFLTKLNGDGRGWVADTNPNKNSGYPILRTMITDNSTFTNITQGDAPKLIYVEGQKFDISSLNIWANYDDNTREKIADCIISKPSGLATEDTSIQVSGTYGGQNYSYTYTITVEKKAVKTALTEAISAANTNKGTAVVSADGNDVIVSNKWVTSEVMKAYTDAIKAAQLVAKQEFARQTEVDDAVIALKSATTTFDSAKDAGKMIVKTALTEAISAANTNKGATAVSTDGKDVATTSKWVTSAVQKAYIDAITSAQTVVDNTKALQTDVDNAVIALKSATATFDKAKADGTKTSSGGGGGKGSSGGSSSTPTTTTTTAKVDKKADSTGAATVKASEMKSADTLKISGNSSADNATLQFDNKAVGAIVAAAGTGDIKISAEKIEKTALTSEQKEKIESLTKSSASQDQPIYSFKVTVGDKKVTDFKSGKVSIEVDYKPTTKGTDNLIVFHIKDNGDVEVIKDCKYDAKTGKLAFSASGFSYFMVGNAADLKASFGDVAKGAWYYDSVSYLLDRNLIKGKTETTFAPEANITRAEFVQILYNMSKNNQGTNTEGVNFQDVNAGAWYYEAVAWGSKAGVVTGANNQFRPEDKISRQEMAVILDRYTSNVAKVTLNKTAEKISFKDSAAIGTWANAAVTTMQQTGIINGIADNGAYKFAPKENATRAQAAKMIAALVKQIQ